MRPVPANEILAILRDEPKPFGWKAIDLQGRIGRAASSTHRALGALVERGEISRVESGGVRFFLGPQTPEMAEQRTRAIRDDVVASLASSAVVHRLLSEAGPTGVSFTAFCDAGLTRGNVFDRLQVLGAWKVQVGPYSRYYPTAPESKEEEYARIEAIRRETGITEKWGPKYWRKTILEVLTRAAWGKGASLREITNVGGGDLQRYANIARALEEERLITRVQIPKDVINPVDASTRLLRGEASEEEILACQEEIRQKALEIHNQRVTERRKEAEQRAIAAAAEKLSRKQAKILEAKLKGAAKTRATREAAEIKKKLMEAARLERIKKATAKLRRQDPVNGALSSIPRDGAALASRYAAEVVVPEGVKVTICPPTRAGEPMVKPEEVPQVFSSLRVGDYLPGKKEARRHGSHL